MPAPLETIAPRRESTGSLWLSERALRLLTPVMACIEPERARIALHGRASDHDARADRLESVARPFHLYALLGRHAPEQLPESWHASFSACLDHGTCPESSTYWGEATNFHQLVVEMGLLVLSLEISREHFWSTLEPGLRERVLDWLESARGVAMHWNNHLFFGIFILEFLRREGRAHHEDTALIEQHFRELESMHRGRGWFRDGLNDSSDFYNAYAFHYYGLSWCYFFADRDDERRKRWMDWGQAFLTSYPTLFASNGAVPGFGRSQIYRFASLAPFGPALALNCCPLDASIVRRIVQTHLDYFLEADAFTAEGWLNIGWTTPLPAIAESYSCTASCYWAAKGFSLLLLPPEHSFWRAEPADTQTAYPDATHPLPGVGLTLRRFGGDSEIINTGTAVSLMNLRYFAAKWSKLAYRASSGTVLPCPAHPWPADLALIAEAEGTRFGRHLTYATEFGENSARCVYALGEKTHRFVARVDTRISWEGAWLLVEHEIEANGPCRLIQGGFALGYAPGEAPEPFPLERGLSVRTPDGRHSLLLDVDGFDTFSLDHCAPDAGQLHTLYPLHTIPLASAQMRGEKLHLSCLIYSGPEHAVDPPESLAGQTRRRDAFASTAQNP
ncbi:DUF2264 domain-containing protein [Ruficoccus amylovorans]|uniref:DUF2264 domain-containing protein n=1 Tax=Ruficoccus amylovorans TaxID=1804625 RepID=A0A842HGL9_9BACT|nr:DUF2264 domain-containing protein [Ruficoccus amylovorans]MBC2595449.1 DUF2264 domain-containing protein [Ruficoccus amylovorans]